MITEWAGLLAILGFGLGLILLRRRSALPSLAGRVGSTFLPDTNDTQLGRAIVPRVARHPGRCGIYSLRDARDSFAARVLLARAAERTLDLQYYIWRNDMTSTLLADALHDAAERGVRVRILLDDNNTSGLDEFLAGLDLHPNIEVRLFNPFVIRKPRIGYLTDFFRANRRMHNKSFTADNQATIIGGRNVGDEYFDATEAGMIFVDFDVLAVGPVVTDVSHDFDRYWNSASAYPANRVLAPVSSIRLQQIKAAAQRVEEDRASTKYMNALRDCPFVRHLVEGHLKLEWAVTRLISDDPAKGLGRADPDKLFPQQLKHVIGEPSSHMEMVMAYFVPTLAGLKSLVSMAQRGVAIRIVTNSLEATDGPYVHAGYAKRRNALLEAGVRLYELRRLSARAPGGSNSNPTPGSSGSTLHAKTFAVDRARVFVGSFNFDPRSADLNTELGFVIDSPALAHQIADAFDTLVPEQAYQVHLSDDGHLYWTERRGEEIVHYHTEPNASIWVRSIARVLSMLPIEWLL